MKLSKLFLHRAVVGVAFALFVMSFTWLVLNERSPFRDYFRNHVAFTNFVGNLLPLPYFGLIFIQPPYAYQDLIGAILEFIQWLLVGYVLTSVFYRR
jgi:hypothetical protein